MTKAPLIRPMKAILARAQRGSWMASSFLALLASFSLACVSIDLPGLGGGAPLVETTLQGSDGPKILMIDIDGVISGAAESSSLFGGSSISLVARVRETLDRAREDEDVQALLLRIDSPGGTATSSEQVYAEIMRFKRERRVPVIAQFLGTAASGAYYVAMAADEVQAHPTTVTGSIGVIFSSVNVAGLMDKLGIEDQTITGGIHKDMGSPMRPLSPEERRQLQSIVDDLHARFREIVALGRPGLSGEEIAVLADGSIYSAPQALANGLVDRIGTLEDAVQELENRLGVEESEVVSYHRPNEWRRNLYSASAVPAPLTRRAAMDAQPLVSLGLERILSRPGFHYLWWPGLGN